MRFITRYNFLKSTSTLCRNLINAEGERIVYVRRHVTAFPIHRQILWHQIKVSPIPCVFFSDDKKHFIDFEKKAEALKDVLEHRKEQLKDTEHRIRQKGEQIVRDIKQQKEITGQKLRVKKEHLVKDILETKAKVKERFEEVIERESCFTIPNILCITRIAMSPYLGYVILDNNYNLALGLVVFAGVTDLLDGWIARNWKGQSSKMGSFLDPLADKVLVATLFVSLTWQDLIPLNLTLLIVARDVALVTAAFVIRYMSLPPPDDNLTENVTSVVVISELVKSIEIRTMSRYFDVTHATVQLAPTFISKVNTVIQLLLVGTTLASPVFGYVDHPALHALCGVTAASTVLSAVSYLVSKDTYKYLKKKSSNT